MSLQALTAMTLVVFVIPANAGIHVPPVIPRGTGSSFPRKRESMFRSSFPAVQVRHSRESGNTCSDRFSPRRTSMTRSGSRNVQPYVYLLASHPRGTLYVGVTSDLVKRVWQHREGLADGFTKRYGVKRLVWYEQHSTMMHAIQREKAIKSWERAWKLQLIETHNPEWLDLWWDIKLSRSDGDNGFPLSRE